MSYDDFEAERLRAEARPGEWCVTDAGVCARHPYAPEGAPVDAEDLRAMVAIWNAFPGLLERARRAEHELGIAKLENESLRNAVTALGGEEPRPFSGTFKRWSYEEAMAFESAHRNHPVHLRLAELWGSPMPFSQLLDEVRYLRHVQGPWRDQALRILSQVRKALGAPTEALEDMVETAAALRARVDELEGKR